MIRMGSRWRLFDEYAVAKVGETTAQAADTLKLRVVAQGLTLA
jgi:hypothetical protein